MIFVCLLSVFHFDILEFQEMAFCRPRGNLQQGRVRPVAGSVSLLSRAWEPGAGLSRRLAPSLWPSSALLAQLGTLPGPET